ncbi:MAG: hypothetical protein US94_C0007G0002 [Berkelbacteria bacterium GW2011_GWB1_38_5]|uniref:Uncharacterized protein n=1 Tax=Berkelbacteria bacterium GW2011_GWB1_38_5 TaxID=1618336 RepID=A0A0G0KFR3_9BACT|nr:MAG: hypothetical protein US94_C0007G0002 [Berkelbacteria bacterium GW2011_GWB1_38_5]
MEPEVKPKSKKGLFWVILILIILVIVGAGIWFGYSALKKVVTPQTSNTEDLEDTYKGVIDVKTAKIDESKSVKKTFGTDGGTLSTVSADGTLYTLTVPSDALILPAEVIMSPLTESPVKGFENPKAGFGVYLSGGFKFNRQAYLTIQPNTPIPVVGQTGAVKWGRCNIASRGYDPEICAGNKKVPFVGGVEPGKVVVLAINETDYKLVLLSPTVPTGEANVYNAEIWRPGAYFGDKIDKKMANELAIKTFSDDYNYSNATEVLMHLLTLGGDLKPFNERIAKFARAEGSYPRETFEGAIILLSQGDKDGYKERIEDFKKTIDKNFKDIRSSFMPPARYVALMNQLSVARKTASLFFKIALAGDDPNVWPDTLPDYDENARDDIDGSNYEDEMRQRTNQSLRNDITSRTRSCSEKMEAIEALEGLGTMDANDETAVRQIIKECADQCKTLEECEGVGDKNDNHGNDPDALAAVNYRITAFLEKGIDCTAETKKTLENYGQNFCK